MPQCFPFEEENVAVEEEVSSEDHETSKLIVYNDHVNTFEWVIECFVKVLRHSHEQAEQLSYMIHFNGKAIVKEGSLEALRPQKDALLERGLSAVIES
jgi:ATP-dependent Clp protease adaptor protein ClpS